MSDSRVMNTEIRSVRAFGFRKNLQTEIRNRKWSDSFFLTWELELVSTKACNNAYYSNQSNDAIQNLPTVSFAYKLTYVSIYNNHYIHMQLPLNKIQQKLCFETKTVVAGQQCLFTCVSWKTSQRSKKPGTSWSVQSSRFWNKTAGQNS